MTVAAIVGLVATAVLFGVAIVGAYRCIGHSDARVTERTRQRLITGIEPRDP